MPFHAVAVFVLGYDFLFKSILGRCVQICQNQKFPNFLFQVSWLRGSDLQVLSSGWNKFTGDNRIRIIPADQSHSWTLAITNVTTKGGLISEIFSLC